MNSRLVPLDKSVGVITGAAVGDALGWPQEDRSQIVGGNAARDVPAEPAFREWTRNSGTQYARYTDLVRAGEYSDDTQLLLAVARACLRGDDWYSWLTRVELPVWPTYERGGGGAVLNASRAWADGRPPWIPNNQRAEAKAVRYFRAGANGVAMRIAPHAVVTIDQPVENLLQRVVIDGVATHGHPRALVGACIHALAIRHALLQEGTLEYGELFDSVVRETTWRDPGLLMNTVAPEWLGNHERFADADTKHPADAWAQTCVEVDRLLEVASERGLSRGATANDQKVLEELGCFDKKQSGSGTVTAVAALYVAARTAPRPMSGLLRTGFLRNADTDTLCSMTGSLLGAIQGSHWLARMLHEVQDSEYLMSIGRDLATTGNGQQPLDEHRSHSPVATTASDLRRWQEALFASGDLNVAPDGRPMGIFGLFELPTRTKNFVTRAVCKTADGQSLYFDRVAKTRAAAIENLRPSHSEDKPDTRNLDAMTAPSTDSPTPSPEDTGDRDPDRPQPLSEPEILTLELRVRDLDASSSFFEQVLGFTCDRRNDKVFLGPLLVLSRDKADRSGDAPLGTVITVGADRLDEIAARAKGVPGAKAEWAEDRSALWLREPGLNVIRVIPRQTATGPASLSSIDDANESAHETRRGSKRGELVETRSNAPTTASLAEANFIQEALFDDVPPGRP